MFKKFAIVLAPFLFAPISLGLTNSAAHAQTTAQWSGWGNCRFSFIPNSYSNWRAYVQYRQGDYAARVVRIEFNGDEPLRLVEAWTSRDIDGNRQHITTDKLSISAGGRDDWTTSPAYYGAPYISNLYKRYANVRFTRTDGSICTGEVELPARL
jgi:hypothetical protein